MDPTSEMPSCELSIVMPCLDEAETIATCVTKARTFLEQSGIDGEVCVADNGSTDGSQEIARSCGARVIEVPEKGYGNALMGGIEGAHGTYVIMGDADDSYDFLHLQPFVDQLRAGDDLVMGNRFRGGIVPGAMPPLHRYVGNPVLSFVGRLFFGIPVGDFHCGLRGFRRDAVLALNLRTTGMEFASEMVVRSSLAGLRISEVPTTLSPDGRSRPPHLRSWRDGWRHLRFLLLFSPRWLFLYPGLALMAVGLLALVRLSFGPVTLGSTSFDIGSLIYAAAAVIIGYQAVVFAILTKVYSINHGLLPPDPRLDRVFRWARLETGLLAGALLVLLGLVLSVAAAVQWSEVGFGSLDPSENIRHVVPAAVALAIGMQTIFNSFFLSVLGLGRRPSATRVLVVEARRRAVR
jgi:glycosyltransferase involved in cell wall biosynthesis